MHRTQRRAGHEALSKRWLRPRACLRGVGANGGDGRGHMQLFLKGCGNVALPPALSLLSFPPSSLLLPLYHRKDAPRFPENLWWGGRKFSQPRVPPPCHPAAVPEPLLFPFPGCWLSGACFSFLPGLMVLGTLALAGWSCVPSLAGPGVPLWGRGTPAERVSRRGSGGQG